MLNKELNKKCNSYNCLKDIPLNEDEETYRNSNQTFSSINAINSNQQYHIYIPKESPPSQFTCCCRDPILCGITILIVFALIASFILLVIIKN